MEKEPFFKFEPVSKKDLFKKFLQITGIAAKSTLILALRVLSKIETHTEHEPTLQEKMCGERMPLSNKYFIK